MNPYVYVAQLVLHPAPGDTGDHTVEIVTSSKALRDRLVDALPADRILHRQVVEGHAQTLDVTQRMREQVILVDHDDEADTCDCPDCQAEREMAELFRQMAGVWPPKGPGPTSTH
jgi:hypothetical protein